MNPIQRALEFVKARRESGLSDETMHILLHLSEKGGSTRDGIAHAASINGTTLPRYITQLMAGGLIRKGPCPQDRRVVLFRLTHQGERLVKSLISHFKA